MAYKTSPMGLEDVRRFFDRAPFMEDLGIEPITVGEGLLTASLNLEPRFFQHTGQAHAGVLITLADHSMGTAAQTLAADGFWAITAEIKSSLLRPARGPQLICEARVLKTGKQLAFTEAEVYSQDAHGRILVLKASATMAWVAAER